MIIGMYSSDSLKEKNEKENQEFMERFLYNLHQSIINTVGVCEASLLLLC